MKKLLYYILFITVMSCRDHYESPVASPDLGYLVVEGIINTGKGGTSIILSRMTNLDRPATSFVKAAIVQVEGDNNQVYTLSEKPNGIYSNQSLLLDSTRKYRLRIKSQGKEYLSAFAQAKATPPIDSISWKQQTDGLQISVHAHDPKNQTKYYRWEYVQTWEYHASYAPSLKYKTIPLMVGFQYTVEFLDPIGGREDTTRIRCWQSNASSSIILGSTEKLIKDEMNMPIIFIQARSKPLSVLYSVIVKQFALSKEEYEYLDIMRKNTELTGSVFDPQPSQLKGNMQCLTNPSEPVIGYIGVASMQEKRIFISNRQLQSWGYSSGCFEEVVKNVSDSVLKAMHLGLQPTIVDQMANNFIITFKVSTSDCVDCTLSGTNKKPDFWP